MRSRIVAGVVSCALHVCVLWSIPSMQTPHQRKTVAFVEERLVFVSSVRQQRPAYGARVRASATVVENGVSAEFPRGVLPPLVSLPPATGGGSFGGGSASARFQFPNAPAPVGLPDVLLSPRVVYRVPALYTDEARRAGIEGVVTLECIVDADGSVSDVHIINSLDTSYGLDEQAVNAVRQWRFDPARQFGAPVSSIVTIDVAFTLR